MSYNKGGDIFFSGRDVGGRARFFRLVQNNCGSGLARESGVSVNLILADKPYSRASQLPHFLDRVISGDVAGDARH
ncbi:hypothetical protein, partial [Pseudomonas sp. PA-6-4F]|uniref:hypothetical protein n=1 Tax=Pseudomonas sp. PA-6-4F TaxID=2665486 RepID=UPI001F45B047